MLIPGKTSVCGQSYNRVSSLTVWRFTGVNSYRMERRWEGHGWARCANVASGEDVWRFKIDVDQRTVITTHVHGGLTVSAIDEDTVLWSLPEVSSGFTTRIIVESFYSRHAACSLSICSL